MSVMFQRETLSGAPDATHEITIPGTRFKAWVIGEEAAVNLAGKLAKTNVAPRKKAKPEIQEIRREVDK